MTTDYHWLQLIGKDRAYSVPVSKPQLYTWWATHRVHPCEASSCKGECKLWFPFGPQTNDDLLTAHGLE